MRDRVANATEVVALASELGLRIAVAESLTGGLLAAALVAVPGASAAFSGGVVAYDTALKATLLGVDRTLLRDRGPVDGDVAKQMAVGVRAACAVETAGGARTRASIGVSTTGVAGPEPDAQTGQPAGTVWIGVSSEAGERSMRLATLEGDRQAIREHTVDAALETLLELLRAQQAVPAQRLPGKS